ncbi:sensor histidine kinase [Paenibacillus endoradicis]|uniref:sensor histidine kinase n=1 Tax=Paenibacillus endoradicis TaxID=2972487 RepID=UPI002158E5A5|nr:sensor histidine kinase [Paenibacillus endoradicis]MCR8660030.1 sensor histidine kinase [Paenibacillus endoradicis]
MNKWYQTFSRGTGLSPYIWLVFCILPFYFIFNSSDSIEMVSGTVLIVAFFICYVLAFLSKGWPIYVWTSFQIVISMIMTVNFSYVYFSIFLAFFIGHIKSKAGFYTLYIIHLISTFVTVNYGLAVQKTIFFTQFPFILISLIIVILLPFNTYNQKKQDQLEGELEHANKRISELVKLEERQRIARDLHDTVGQKLSLIGLKSDLAGKLLHKDLSQAEREIQDIRSTARIASKEVRELVTKMRGTRLEDEVYIVSQILAAAEIGYELNGDPKLQSTALLAENVLCMCMKEAVTNVVKHSQATHCYISINTTADEVILTVHDDGIGITFEQSDNQGNGLRGMKERLEFVNGSLYIDTTDQVGTTLKMSVPHAVRQPMKESIT